MSRRPLSLTDDERFLLNHYSNIYNEQLKAIDLMYNELKETRDIIDFITKVDERHLRNTTSTTFRATGNYIPETNENTSTSTSTSTGTNTNRNHRSSTIYRWDYYIPIDDLEDVIVYPSQEEITNNTRSVTFNNIIEPLNTSCPITLERFEDNTECTQIIGCGHLFNRDGLRQWLRANVRCPICRYDMRNRNRNDRSSSETTITDASLNVLSEQLLTSLFSNRRRTRSRMDTSS